MTTPRSIFFMVRFACVFLICSAFIAAFFYHARSTKHEADEAVADAAFPRLNPVILNNEPDPGLTSYQLDKKSFGAKTLSIIQSDSGVKLPAGSRGIKFIYLPPIDPSWAAKIEIPKEASASMLAELSKISGEQINISGEIGPRTNWWYNHKSKVLFDRQSSPMDNYLRMTLTEEADSIFLYIQFSVF
jgi:hypothetical protein